MVSHSGGFSSGGSLSRLCLGQRSVILMRKTPWLLRRALLRSTCRPTSVDRDFVCLESLLDRRGTDGTHRELWHRRPFRLHWLPSWCRRDLPLFRPFSCQFHPCCQHLNCWIDSVSTYILWYILIIFYVCIYIYIHRYTYSITYHHCHVCGWITVCDVSFPRQLLYGNLWVNGSGEATSCSDIRWQPQTSLALPQIHATSKRLYIKKLLRDPDILFWFQRMHAVYGSMEGCLWWIDRARCVRYSAKKWMVSIQSQVAVFGLWDAKFKMLV